MSEAEFEVLLLAGRVEVRGSCAYTLRLAAGLGEQGISARVITPDARLVDAQARAQLKIQEVPRLDTPLWSELVQRTLLCELRSQPPRLIHIQSQRILKQGQWLAHKLNRPYVLTMHEYLAPKARFKLDMEYCRRIIAVSESVRDNLWDGLKVLPELVTVIPSGVETSTPVDLSLPLEPGHVPVISTAGPLESIKGIPYFLGAARQVLGTRRDVEFLVSGAGPEEANLRRVARELEIADKVTFVPYVLGFSDSLAATDIFCLPSLQQGLGTIMLEAMALGRPVIATGVGGVSSVIRDGETGLIVPPQNSGELARRIIELLDQPARARAIGAQARKLVVEQYSVTTMVQRTAQLYRELVPVPVIASVTTRV
jgi:glycosyltransferase involved in cell wall biosynthesis